MPRLSEADFLKRRDSSRRDASYWEDFVAANKGDDATLRRVLSASQSTIDHAVSRFLRKLPSDVARTLDRHSLNQEAQQAWREELINFKMQSPQFPAFAASKIINRLFEYLRDERYPGLSVRAVMRFRDFDAAARAVTPEELAAWEHVEVAERLKTTPRIVAIAKRMGATPDVVEKISCFREPISLDSSRLRKTLLAPSAEDEVIRAQSLRDAVNWLDMLNPRHKAITKLHFGLPVSPSELKEAGVSEALNLDGRSRKEIASAFRLTGSRVSKIIKTSIAKLQKRYGKTP